MKMKAARFYLTTLVLVVGLLLAACDPAPTDSP